MSKICGYSCEHNKSGVCQISGCDKKSIISDKTEVQTLRLDDLDYTIVPNSDIKQLLDKLEKENKKINGTIQTYDILLKANVEENKQLKEKLNCDLQWAFKYEKQVDNWNKLKRWLYEDHCLYVPEIARNSTYQKVLEKMYEIEKESNSNEI